MNWPDFFNGCFEFLGGLSLINNCRLLFKDKQLKGVSISSTAFFTSWGLWNLFFYPHLGQWYSFAGGLVIVSANTTWVAMAIYYYRKNK